MGQFFQDVENGQNEAFYIFFELCCDVVVRLFRPFSAVLKRFCPEPELEPFEVDDIDDDGDDDLWLHYFPNIKQL